LPSKGAGLRWALCLPDAPGAAHTFQVDLKPRDEPPFHDVRGFAKLDQPPAEG
jgi:hypothetical protein